MLKGTFKPAAPAPALSRAVHFDQPETPSMVRLSNSTELPMLPDNDPNANPRRMAVRFVLGDHKHMDFVAHSTNASPTQNGQGFLDFLPAAAASDPVKLEGSPLEAFSWSTSGCAEVRADAEVSTSQLRPRKLLRPDGHALLDDNNVVRYGR